MIVSHENRFVFVHNPKVGGSSIRRQLQHLHDDEIEYWHQGWNAIEHRVIDLAHLTADQWYDDSVVGYLTFGFVRNPYTRFWSSLNEYMRRHGDSMPITKDNIAQLLTPASIRYDWRFIHFCPQNAFFYVGQDCYVDFIGRFETLERDWARASALCNSIFDPVLPQNKERQVTTDRFDPELREQAFVHHLINRLYQRDFMLFGYDMTGLLGIKDTHADRIEVIHNPLVGPMFHGQERGALSFTPGERKALEQQRATVYPQS